MKFKKSVIILTILIIFLFLTGCLNYKSYDQPLEEENEEDLLSEIAEIEKELEISEEEQTEEPKIEELLEEIEQETELEEETESEQEITVPLGEEIDTSKLQKIEVDENELIDLNIKVNDPDNDKINYTFSLPLNSQGKWKTNYGDTGEYVVTITASDGKLTSKKDILLVINRVNVPPIIKKIKDKTVKEGETIKLEPQVIDPNGDSITVALSEPLTTGTWKTDHTGAGEYEITITASDGELESKETFLLTVIDVNIPPEIIGLKDIIAEEGETVEIKPTITDLDNEPVTTLISIICSSNCQFLKSGEIAKECDSNECIWKTEYTDHGIYKVVITADDDKKKTTEEITLTIEDVNQPPTIGPITNG